MHVIDVDVNECWKMWKEPGSERREGGSKVRNERDSVGIRVVHRTEGRRHEYEDRSCKLSGMTLALYSKYVLGIV